MNIKLRAKIKAYGRLDLSQTNLPQTTKDDAGKFLVGMAEQDAKVDVILMDPPRSGSDEAFLSSVVKMSPAKVVYVSCNPETLARDLKYLTKHGYKVQRACACDMFAFTSHCESVVLLRKLVNYMVNKLKLFLKMK